MFIRVLGNFWYKLEHLTTRRYDYTTEESDFCRFQENDTPWNSETLSSEENIYSVKNEVPSFQDRLKNGEIVRKHCRKFWNIAEEYTFTKI